MPEQPEGDKTFTQRWPISLWLRVKAQAQAEDVSLNAWMQQAAEVKLRWDKRNAQVEADLKGGKIEQVLGNRKATAQLDTRLEGEDHFQAAARKKGA